MKYDKPALISLGKALQSILGEKDSTSLHDTETNMYVTTAAYQADE